MHLTGPHPASTNERRRDGLKTRHVLMAFTFIVLLIFLIIVVSSRSTEMGKLYPDDVDIDAGLTQTAPSPQASAEANYDVNPAPEKTGSPKDTKPDIDIDSWQYLLANSDNNIGKYSPQVVAVEETAQYFDERAVDALVDFLDAARAAGYSPYIMASYRPYSSQEYIYNGKASQLSWPDYPDAQDYADAAKLVAAPGTSDHQTGLAVDITDKYYSTMDASRMDQEFLTWLADNCAEYGFILRYPSSKVSITGWDEPWHFRYVGKEAAVFIMDNNLCLEQFVSLYK